jgi:hypothetical protein
MEEEGKIVALGLDMAAAVEHTDFARPAAYKTKGFKITKFVCRLQHFKENLATHGTSKALRLLLYFLTLIASVDHTYFHIEAQLTHMNTSALFSKSLAHFIYHITTVHVNYTQESSSEL